MRDPRHTIPLPHEETAVLRSIAYSALFDYPLTLAQLRTALLDVAVDEETLSTWIASSRRIASRIEHREGLYIPRGRHDLPLVRRARQRASVALIDQSRPGLVSLVAMPFVRAVTLSGSVAHGNADEDADLDLFVIVAPGRVWLVTVTALVLARLGGWRRRLCLNYVISERQLAVGPPDLFTANQIIHLVPISGGETYRRFLAVNQFVERIYPNFVPREVARIVEVPDWIDRMRQIAERLLDWTLAPAAERVCRWVYGRHLKRQSARWLSVDQVRLEPECLKLHTRSHRKDVLSRFEAAVADFGRADQSDIHSPAPARRQSA